MAGGSKLAEAFVTLRLDKSLLAREMLGVKGMLLAAVGKMGTEGGKKMMRFMARGVKSGASMVLRALKKVISPWSMLMGGVGLYAGARMISAFIRPFAAFEAQMDKSLAILAGVQGREEEIEATTRMLAKRYAKSHEEMARSIFFFASAGLDASKTLQIFETMTKFAVAGSFDMATATDMMTDSLSALGWASENAVEYGRNLAKLADMITKGNMIANTTVEQLAEALMHRGANAITQFGLAAEEGMGALLALADKGFAKGGEAGMQFAMLLEGLAMAWKNHKTEMKAAGIELYDAEGNFNSLTAILDDFNRHLGPLSTEARNEFIQGTLAMDKRAARVMGALRSSASLIRDKFVPALKAAGGSVDILAEKNMANLLTVWDQFKITIVDLTVTINKRLKALWEGVTEVATALADKLVGAIDKKALQWLRDWATGLGENLKTLADLIDDIKIGEFGEGMAEVLKITARGLGEVLLIQMRAVGDILIEAGKQAGEQMARTFADAWEESRQSKMGRGFRYAAGTFLGASSEEIEAANRMARIDRESARLTRDLREKERKTSRGATTIQFAHRRLIEAGKETAAMFQELRKEYRSVLTRGGGARKKPPGKPLDWMRPLRPQPIGGRLPGTRMTDEMMRAMGRSQRGTEELFGTISGRAPLPGAKAPFRQPGRQIARPPERKLSPKAAGILRESLGAMRKAEAQAKIVAALATRMEQDLGIAGRKEALAGTIKGIERKREQARRLPTGEVTALENLHQAIQKDILAANRKKQIDLLDKQLKKMEEMRKTEEEAGDKVVAAIKETLAPVFAEEMP